jgi:hypothetical protein
LGDDEASSEFRPKIASVLNLVRLESRTGQHSPGAPNKLLVDGLFQEALESQKKDDAPLLHLVHSDDLKYLDIVRRFATFSFKDLLFEFLSLIVKVRLFE